MIITTESEVNNNKSHSRQERQKQLIIKQGRSSRSILSLFSFKSVCFFISLILCSSVHKTLKLGISVVGGSSEIPNNTWKSTFLEPTQLRINSAKSVRTTHEVVIKDNDVTQTTIMIDGGDSTQIINTNDRSNDNSNNNDLSKSYLTEGTDNSKDQTNNNKKKKIKQHSSCPPPPYIPSSKQRKGIKKTLANKDIFIYEVFLELIEIFNDANCPYFISSGTLLGFVRDCQLWADLDFVIPLEWWKQPQNAMALQTAMDQRGNYRAWKFGSHFGTPGEPGYAQSWSKHGQKIDFISIIMEPDNDHSSSNNNNRNENSQPQQFTISKKGDPYLFVEFLWVEGKRYACPISGSKVEEVQWGNTTIRAPTPFDSVLTSYYGKDWSEPFQGTWEWDTHPFEIGSCMKEDLHQIIQQ